MYKIYLLFFFFLILKHSSFSQNEGLLKIDTIDLKRHLSFIASDSLMGRQLGTEINGLEITADYLAGFSGNLGLKPGNEDYFQDVGMVLIQPDTNNYIALENRNGNIVFHSKSILNISGISGPKTFVGEDIVIAGFGIQDSTYDDLLHSEIENKVVVIAQGNAEIFEMGKEFRWNSRLERKKIETISKKNPKAIVIVTNPKDTENKTFSQMNMWMNRERYALKGNENDDKSIQTVIVLPELADKLLGKKGSYKKYLLSIAQKRRSDSINKTSLKLTMNIGSSSQTIAAKNVLAYIEGGDSVLKEECIVFMAHYDHLGIDKEGNVYNGADDNGSGTVTLMELAEAFSTLETKPKRSVVFLWVTGEEMGMLGSGYYAEHPLFAMEKTALCINIDMNGRVYEPRDSVWKRSPKMVKDFDGLFTLSNNVWPELKKININKCEELGLVPDTSLPASFLRSSDHYHFHNKGVPILNYATGYHADYHRVSDEISKINFKKMKRVADLCFLVGWEVANRDDIVFDRSKNE